VSTASAVRVDDGTAAAEWEVWTTRARLVVTDPTVLERATTLVRGLLDEVDRAASRFRPDSEVRLIAASAEQVHTVSPLLADLVRAALVAAAETDGDVDPTLGTVLTRLGYGEGGLGSGPGAEVPLPRWTAQRRATWRDVDLEGNRLRMPPGTLLDLGATAKAVTADRVAEEVAAAFGCGVMVSLGGDLRVAGPEPTQGWNVLVQDGEAEPASHVRLTGAAAVATSSTLHRRWRRNGQLMHHLIDPATRLPAAAVWRTVSVAAATCVRANTLSTQAVLLGDAAPEALTEAGVSARLVAADGEIVLVGGWPA
jgi:thiamine biosynthesis lipoprotein